MDSVTAVDVEAQVESNRNNLTRLLDWRQFHASAAEEYGLNEAIVWAYIQDGITSKWSPFPHSNLSSRFPWWSRDELSAIFQSLADQEVFQMGRGDDGLVYARLHPSVIANREIETTAYRPTVRIKPIPPLKGYVYLLEGGGFHKIGLSTNPKKRFNQIAPKLPFEVKAICVVESEDWRGLEQYWHQRFADKRGNGEWFNLTSEDVASFCAQDAMEAPE